MVRELRPGKSTINRLSNHLEVILKKEYNRPIYRPSWNDFTVLVFRPIPYYDSKTRKLSPLCDGDELGDWFGGTFHIGQINSGRKSARCILVHRAEPLELCYESPIYLVSEMLRSYSRVKWALAEGRRHDAQAALQTLNKKVWEVYRNDSDTKVDVKSAAFLQCPVLAVKSKPFEVMDGLDPNKPLPLVMLIGSAMTAVVDAITNPNPDAESKYIDVIDFANGYYIEVGRKGYNKNQWFPDSGVPGENFYAARIFQKYSKYSANLEKYKGSLINKIVPWEDMFTLPDPEEQIALLCWTGVNPVYLYTALVDSFPLPRNIITRAMEILGERSFTGVDIPKSADGPAQSPVDFDNDEVADGSEPAFPVEEEPSPEVGDVPPFDADTDVEDKSEPVEEVLPEVSEVEEKSPAQEEVAAVSEPKNVPTQRRVVKTGSGRVVDIDKLKEQLRKARGNI